MYAWLKSALWLPLYEAARNWQKDDGPTLAAAVAYYAAFSFFPLLLLLIAALGFALQFSTGAQNARQELLDLLAQNVSPNLTSHVGAVLDQISVNAVVGGPLGLVALLFAAVGVFNQIERAFDRIWHVPGQAWRGVWAAVLNALYYRLRAFLMLLGTGVLVLTALGAGVAASTLRALTADLPGGRGIWILAQIALSLALFGLSFTFIYKVLPKVSVRWSEAARGGLLAALLWEVTRQLLTLFLVGEKYTAYGIIGSLIALMLWIYVASSVLFLGAEYVRVLGRRRPG
ncbi:MAG: YihY/virulence factor BrkB family protein [Pirellulales bacterium]|nr:YihY/virulence factor BrkB family protein [Pirellulales bacterium]